MQINYSNYQDQLQIATTSGLKKTENEDVFNYKVTKGQVSFCLADGHWGDFAAKYISNQLIKSAFPSNRADAIKKIKDIEKALHQKLWLPDMNPDANFTAEASFIAVEKTQTKISILSYGDCRLVLVRNRKVVFNIKKTTTWLGAFSYLNLRNRISVDKALIYQKLDCLIGDTVMIFTDGVDECIYGKKTLTYKWLARQIDTFSPIKSICKNIFDVIQQKGAEDNATLVLIRI